jgi:hypothetical protein
MYKISPIRSLIIFSVLAVAAFSAGAGAAYGQCDKISDQQIVDAVYAKFAANGKLKAHLNHLNFTVQRDPVSGAMQSWKTRGWVDTADERTLLQGLMLEVYYDLGGCFKISGMNVSEVWLSAEVPEDLKSSSGCPYPQQACGDICIPAGETCNIKGR